MARSTRTHIGREREPLLIIDDFAADPRSLRDAAIAASFVPALHHYPGVRAPLPPDYLLALLQATSPMLHDVFGIAAPMIIDASFSIVTAPPEALSVRQRLPHCDAFARDRTALVHYLAPTMQGGTTFYRHRSTGFEAIDEDRAPLFFPQLEAELRHGGLPATGYINGDTALFEAVASVEPRYNRAILYRSRSLHSGAIPAGAALPADPERGRLTVTAFFADSREASS